ncbi:MAG: hypothetical protein V7K40_06005 [Nostoc sp.]|uniref:hypothetical protein n=1 Tax=Nostoc sp. TaxID=1180 RepID=UPI002FFCD8AA
MLKSEKLKEKTNSWTKKLNTKKLAKYSHSLKVSQFCVSFVPIQENYSSFNLLKDNNCDIYLSNQIKTEASKVSLLKTKSWKQEAFSWREEKVPYVYSQQSLLQKSKTRKAKQIINRPSNYLLRQAEIKGTFMKLANQWRSETKHSKSFHLNNPQPISWNQLTDFIRSLGYPIKHISYQNWQSQLSNQARSQSNPLYALLPFFLQNSPEHQQAREPKISCQAIQTALAESSIICPPVDTKLLNTYFDYFISSGFLDAK